MSTAALLVMTAPLLAASCDGGRSDAGPNPAGRTTLRVFAAASLTTAMADIEAAYETAHPTIDVEVSLAGSSTLRTQILEGAPADVVATANSRVMDDLVQAGAVSGTPQPFASNRLVIALAPGNPGRIEQLADLGRPEVFVGLCATGVPCGDLADSVLAEAGVTVDPDTREPDVRSLTSKVRSGELDAGLVYATDVAAGRSAGVDSIDLPTGLDVTATYPVAVLSASGVAEVAEDFAAFLIADGNPAGAEILSDHGFGRP